MDWNSGITYLGIGLAIFTWVASMIWHTLPRPLLVSLLVVSICLMLAWPVTSGVGWLRTHIAPTLGLSAAVLVGAILGGLILGGAYYFTEPQLEPPIPKTLNKALETVPTITLTVRFNPMAFFPFSIPPQTTSYAILARPKEDVSWGAYEIKNDGNDSLIWPEKRSLQWAGTKLPQKSADDFPGLPDMAIALDITNHSNNELINVKAEVEYEFLEAIKEATSVRSGPTVSKRKHAAIIPVIKQNSTLRLYIGNQSAKHFVIVTFPTEATALLPSETERRKIKLVKIGTNIVESLPLFTLSPANVRWQGFPTGD